MGHTVRGSRRENSECSSAARVGKVRCDGVRQVGVQVFRCRKVRSAAQPWAGAKECLRREVPCQGVRGLEDASS